MAFVSLAMSACSGTGSPPTASTTQSTSSSISGHVLSRDAAATPIRLPVSAFVDAQGKFNGGYIAFLAENVLTGCPGAYNLFIDIDYAGLDNNIIGVFGGTSLGTSETGTLVIHPQSDGTAIVKLDMFTTNALTYAHCLVPNSGANDFPYLFGYPIAQVAAGEPAGLGSSQVQLEFTMPTPTSPMPDLLQLAAYPSTLPGYSLISQKYGVTAVGPLRSAFGVPNNTPGKLHMSAIGSIRRVTGGEDQDGFAAEEAHISIQPQ
jgi:hypothetical protein